MNKRWILTQESFDRLLNWLSTDRELAGEKYERIRLALIKIFARRGCSQAEQLADETINRVVSKVPELTGNYSGEHAAYFYAVAQKLILEQLKKRNREITLEVEIPVQPPDDDDPCLVECLGKIEPESRWLILEYYQATRQVKIDNRKVLASRLNITTSTLRMRVSRIKDHLKKCILECRGREML